MLHCQIDVSQAAADINGNTVKKEKTDIELTTRKNEIAVTLINRVSPTCGHVADYIRRVKPGE